MQVYETLPPNSLPVENRLFEGEQLALAENRAFIRMMLDLVCRLLHALICANFLLSPAESLKVEWMLLYY